MTSREATRPRWIAALAAIGLLVSACGPSASAPPSVGGSAAPSQAPASESVAPSVIAFEPKDVEVVVHSGPGGGNDTLAREMAKILLDEKIASTLYPVSNKEGGSGAVAMAYMAEASGEANTWAVHSVTWVATPLTLPAGTVTFHELTPIAQLVEERAVLAVKASSPYKTLKDLLEAAKTKKLIHAGGSVAALDNVNATILKKAAGVDWSFVGFEGGGERTAALLGGTADMQIEGARDFIELVRGGEVRILATFSKERTSVFPDVPTVSEATGLDLDFVVERRGVLGPPKMPAEAVAYWADVMKRMMETDAWKKYSTDSGFSDVYGGPDVHLQSLTSTEATLKEVFKEIDVIN